MLIPIAFPLMPKALLVQIQSTDGIVHTIHATIYDVLIEFDRNNKGGFETATDNQIDKPYMAYILRTLDRMFGNLT